METASNANERASARRWLLLGAAAVMGMALGVASLSGGSSNHEGTGGSMATDDQTANEFMYGVTLDRINDLDSSIAAMQRLPVRPTVRLVFDEHVAPGIYHGSVERLAETGDLMGSVLDSLYVHEYSPAEYRERTEQYVDAFAGHVPIWEIGNEVNGEWLLNEDEPRSLVAEKVATAYDVVTRAAGATAITLHYNEGCFDRPEHEMFRWVRNELPQHIKQGVDYVLLSYYEENCDHRQPNWQSVFERLRQEFPDSRLGFGEVGLIDGSPAEKAAYLQRYYSIRPDIEGFVGGYFWWYFYEDMVEPLPDDPRLLDALAKSLQRE